MASVQVQEVEKCQSENYQEQQHEHKEETIQATTATSACCCQNANASKEHTIAVINEEIKQATEFLLDHLKENKGNAVDHVTAHKDHQNQSCVEDNEEAELQEKEASGCSNAVDCQKSQEEDSINNSSCDHKDQKSSCEEKLQEKDTEACSSIQQVKKCESKCKDEQSLKDGKKKKVIKSDTKKESSNKHDKSECKDGDDSSSSECEGECYENKKNEDEEKRCGC
eukprot:Gb_07990 [translate_table: standard]